MKILLLAGTREARELSFSLEGVDLISSLAGVTQRPTELGGTLRVGGFGGAKGLMDFLSKEGVSHVIDGTHPFAVQMSRNAYEACAALGVPLLQVVRPEWGVDARWKAVADMKAAARKLNSSSRVFLATGRGSLPAFMERKDVWFLARVIDDLPGEFPLASGEFLVSKPPFSVEEEMETLRTNEIDTLVVRNSGGKGGYEKIEAAHQLGISIVMVSRPDFPIAHRVDSVTSALEFMEANGWLSGAS